MTMILHYIITTSKLVDVTGIRNYSNSNSSGGDSRHFLGSFSDLGEKLGRKAKKRSSVIGFN